MIKLIKQKWGEDKIGVIWTLLFGVLTILELSNIPMVLSFITEAYETGWLIDKALCTLVPILIPFGFVLLVYNSFIKKK